MALSLTKLHAVAWRVVAAALSAARFAGRRFVNDERASIAREDAHALAHALGIQVQNRFRHVARIVKRVDDLPLSDDAGRAAAARDLQILLPEARAVAVLSRDEAQAPRYADLAAKADVNRFPYLAWHRDPSGGVAIDLMYALRASDQSRSYVYAELDPAPINALLTQTLPPNYRAALFERLSGVNNPLGGDADAIRASDPSTWVDLDFPPWTVAVADLPGRTSLRAGAWLDLGLLVAAFLVVLAVPVVVARVAIRGTRHDIQSLARMFQDIRDGTVRVDYPMELAEFNEIFQHLRDSGRKLVEQQRAFKDMGLIDHLSQLPNRRAFEQKLRQVFDQRRSNGVSSILMIDLDRFKTVNDTHGHDAGDALIVNFSAALKKLVRRSDFLARLGGDEFCVIFAYADIPTAEALANRIRDQLPREIHLKQGHLHPLQWTGGIGAFRRNDTEPEQALKRADRALLQAKDAGRNQTYVYESGGGPPSRRGTL